MSVETAIPNRKAWSFEDLAKHFGPVDLHRPYSKAEFVQLADRHPDLQMERDEQGTITLMSPVKRGSARRENILNYLLNHWNQQHGHGEVFGPNGTFDLPNGSTRMPDASWISPEKLAFDDENEESYIQIVPDFVVEIRSATDRLGKLLNKMEAVWMPSGVRLAWMIDPIEEKAYVFRANGETEIIEGFSGKTLFGEDVLVGFELNLETMKRRG